MSTPKHNIEQLFKQLSVFLPDSMEAVGKDLTENVRSGVEGVLRSMNLVTREEFDVQSAVLLRTREKLELMEAEVERLEQLIVPKGKGDRVDQNT